MGDWGKATRGKEENGQVRGELNMDRALRLWGPPGKASGATCRWILRKKEPEDAG